MLSQCCEWFMWKRSVREAVSTTPLLPVTDLNPHQVIYNLGEAIELYQIHMDIHATKAREAKLVLEKATAEGATEEARRILRSNQTKEAQKCAEYLSRKERLDEVRDKIRTALENQRLIELLYHSSLTLGEIIKDARDVERIKEALESGAEMVNEQSEMLAAPLIPEDPPPLSDESVLMAEDLPSPPVEHREAGPEKRPSILAE